MSRVEAVLSTYHKLVHFLLPRLVKKPESATVERRGTWVSSYFPTLSARARAVALDKMTNVKPPASVRGMTELDRDAFATCVAVPSLLAPVRGVRNLSKTLGKRLLRIPGVRPVGELEPSHELHDTHRLLLLDPEKFEKLEPGEMTKSLEEKEVEVLKENNVDPASLTLNTVQLGYENFKADQILTAILGEETAVSGFSQVGHIVHVNLRDLHEPFKPLIGQVLLDKVKTARSVVNKTSAIDNTFRNFSLEVLAGVPNFETECKEHGLAYGLDFSKVYWNPRLSTEHQRIVAELPPNSLVFDVFAGIGPFALPAAKKGCQVLANDLNPESYKWLERNVQRNKLSHARLQTFNLDGREFLRSVVGPRLTELFDSMKQKGPGNTERDRCEDLADDAKKSSEPDGAVGKSETNSEKKNKKGIGAQISGTKPSAVYFVMNLPALAIEFLDALPGLLTSGTCVPPPLLPKVRCYCFAADMDARATVEARAEAALGCPLPGDTHLRFVRNVAPNKDMWCLEFSASEELLVGERRAERDCELPEKKARLEHE